MKKIISKTLALVAICTTLFSFTPKPGGEGFEIYLNNRLLVQRFGNEMNNSSNLQLASATANDQLVIKYHHCGQVGKNRVVTIKDEQNNILKEFRYTDASKPVLAISVPVKDLLALKKGNTVLKMYYTSAELPKGRMLTSISTSTAITAKL